MTTTVELSSILPADPDTVWQHVKTPALLEYIASPMILFVPPGGAWPSKTWQAGEARVGMWLGGVLPIGWQVIGIEFPPDRDGVRMLRDNGYGPLIKRWDHWIEIKPHPQGTHYTDRVHVDAGFLTPIVASFARVFYAHRQRRWKQLAKADFAPLTA